MAIINVKNMLNQCPLRTVSPSETIEEVCAHFQTKNTSALAVVENGALVGLLTRAAVTKHRAVNALKLPEVTVKQLMTSPAETIGEQASLADAIAKMNATSTKHLAVLQGKALIGMICLDDIPSDYLTMFERYKAFQNQQLTEQATTRKEKIKETGPS